MSQHLFDALSNVRIFVTDFDEAFEFYAQTLALPVRFRSPDGTFAMFETGQAKLMLRGTRVTS